MAATTTPDGIVYPTLADQGDDLPAVLATLAGSVQTAITNLRNAQNTALTTHTARQAERTATGKMTYSAGIQNGFGAGMTITFPAGRFSQPPIVLLTTSRSRIGTAVHSVSTTSANIYLENWSGGNESTPIDVYWTAFQHSTGAAAG